MPLSGEFPHNRRPPTRPTLGVQIKTGDRCKICKSPWRAEIEDAIAHKQRKEPMTDGTKVTEAWICDNSERLWGMKLFSPNLVSHQANHFKSAPAGQGKDSQDLTPDASAELTAVVAEKGIEALHVAPEEYLQAVVAIGMEKIKKNPNSVTVEHALKAVAELTKRKHDEAKATILEGLTGAIAAAVLPKPPAPAIEAEAEEVVVDVLPAPQTEPEPRG